MECKDFTQLLIWYSKRIRRLVVNRLHVQKSERTKVTLEENIQELNERFVINMSENLKDKKPRFHRCVSKTWSKGNECYCHTTYFNLSVPFKHISFFSSLLLISQLNDRIKDLEGMKTELEIQQKKLKNNLEEEKEKEKVTCAEGSRVQVRKD